MKRRFADDMTFVRKVLGDDLVGKCQRSDGMSVRFQERLRERLNSLKDNPRLLNSLNLSSSEAVRVLGMADQTFIDMCNDLQRFVDLSGGDRAAPRRPQAAVDLTEEEKEVPEVLAKTLQNAGSAVDAYNQRTMLGAAAKSMKKKADEEKKKVPQVKLFTEDEYNDARDMFLKLHPTCKKFDTNVTEIEGTLYPEAKDVKPMKDYMRDGADACCSNYDEAETDFPCLRQGYNLEVSNYQKLPVLALEKQRGLLLMHGVGTGKTRTAVLAAMCYLSRRPNNKVIVVTPAGLVKNFECEIKNYCGPAYGTPAANVAACQDVSKIKVMSYDKYVLDTDKQYEEFKKYMKQMEVLKKTYADPASTPAEKESVKKLYGRLKKDIDEYNGRQKSCCSDTMLIIDEAHRLRNPPLSETLEKEESGMTVRFLRECAKNADRVLLMTATPMYNSVRDIMNLMVLIDPTLHEFDMKKNRGYFVASAGDGKEGWTPELLKKMFKCRVSMYLPDFMADKPRTLVNEVFIKMDKTYQDEYMKYIDPKAQAVVLYDRQQRPNIEDDDEEGSAFWNKQRQGANAVPTTSSQPAKLGPKFEYVKALMKDVQRSKQSSLQPPKRVVLFSNFVKMGTDLMKKVIDEMNAEDPSVKIEYAEIIGKVSGANRQEIVNRFNMGSSMPGSVAQTHWDKACAPPVVVSSKQAPVDVLLISSAGGEGLDLKGTTDIVLLEPSWNAAVVEQVIGRGVRRRSHEHLEPRHRRVVVHKLYSVTDSEFNLIKCIADKIPGSQSDADIPVTLRHDHPTMVVVNDRTLEPYESKFKKTSADLWLQFATYEKRNNISKFIRMMKGLDPGYRQEDLTVEACPLASGLGVERWQLQADVQPAVIQAALDQCNAGV